MLTVDCDESEDGVEKAKPRAFWIGALRSVITVVCIGYIALVLIREREVILSIDSLRIAPLLLLLALYCVHYALYTVRFRIIMGTCTGHRPPYLSTLNVLITGMLLNSIMPQSGSVYRGVRLKKQYQIPYTGYVSTYVSFVWLDMSLNLILALLIIWANMNEIRVSGIPAAYFIGGFLAALVSLPFLVSTLLRIFASGSRQPGKWLIRGRSILDSATGTIANPQFLMQVSLLSSLIFLNVVLVFYVGFRLFGYSVPITTLALFCVLYKVSAYILVTPGNLGIRELAYGILGDQLGIGMPRVSC